MKNKIEFYYNIVIDNLHKKNDKYFFYINNNKFVFRPYYDSKSRINTLMILTTYISNIIDIDKVVVNKYNSPITVIDGIPYILINYKDIKKISLVEISNLSNINNFENCYVKELERNNWEILWENRIDYLEEHIGHNEKKYSLIRESFDYFIGLAENAISYLINTKKELKPSIYDKKVLSHNNLKSSLYDPSNIILDHKSRDVAEYIKLSFLNNNKNIFDELQNYFYYNYYSEYGIRILFSRIIYPNFYFDIYDDIIQNKCNEKKLNIIINKINDYELFLWNIYSFLSKYHNIPIPEWIKKRGLNPH